MRVKVLLAGAAAMGAGLLSWVAWSALWTPEPTPAPEARVAELRPVRPAQKRPPERRKAKAHKRERPVAPRKAEPVVPPEEKARIRSDFRAERLQSLDEQLDAYAEEAGWDPELTEEVRSILVETMTHIGEELARVDQGQADWLEMRPEIRKYRLEQAAEIEALLGDGFDAFVEGMAFGRFLGERPPGRQRFDPYKR